MDLSTFLVVCFIVAFLYLAKIALERKKERDDHKKKSEAYNRKLLVWKSYLKYLELEYEETEDDNTLDEIIKTREEIDCMENT